MAEQRCRPNLNGSQRVALQVVICFLFLICLVGAEFTCMGWDPALKMTEFRDKILDVRQVARQHFGEPAEVICDALMMRPRRSLRELQQDCPSLPLGQLRNGLLVLIQHNMVGAFCA